MKFCSNNWSTESARLNEQFGYAYDKAWNLQRRTNNALVQTFGENNLNELTNATRSGTLTVAGLASQPGANLSSVSVSGTGLTTGNATVYANGSWAKTGATLADGNNTYSATATDTAGRTAQDSLTVNLPATTTFSYDFDGNLTNDGWRVFEYDYENQLTNVYVASAWRSEFKYDAFGRRRVRKEYTWQSSAWVLTNEVRYVYDGMLTVQERDANNLAMVSYTRGNDLSGTLQGAGGIGGLLARTANSQLLSPNSSSAHAYYHCDGNGNITALVDTNGIIVAKYNYDPYGNLLGMSGPMAEANTYRFSSKEYAGNAALYYYGFRFYEPNLQRWLNRDPIEESGGLNLYGSVGNDPLNNLDPYGLWSPEAHDCLLQHALKDILPQKDIDKIKKSSRDFDKETQSAEESYKHSMRMKGQSVRDATGARDRFIERKCAEACQAYKNNNKQKALKLLGEALHPVMDASSPKHTDKRGNPKTWNPLRPWGHSPTDWIGDETSKDITPAIYKKQDKAIREACEKVFGK